MAASYPGAVKVFASRSAGQVIGSAHVNDLQDEVNAIEAGLLNGTAPLNSSNSTMVGLSVTSVSTIAGTLNVTANSTFTGTVNFTGVVTGITASGVSVKVTHSAATQLSSGTWTGLNWDTELYDGSSMHSTASNSSRILFAGSSGVYHLGAVVSFSSVAGGQVFARVMYNDSSVVTQTHVNGGDFTACVNLAADVRIASSADYVTVQVYQNVSTGRIFAESTGAPLGFWAHRVST